MTEKLPDEPEAEEQTADEAEEQAVDELEQELLDAMRDLRRKNKNVEDYLDGLARSAEKPPEQENEEQPNQDQ
jgi:hypothetical protein